MKKKIALITGASGGIGGACAETLARAGYTVLLHGCHGLAATFSPCIIVWTRWCCARAFRIPGFSAT